MVSIYPAKAGVMTLFYAVIAGLLSYLYFKLTFNITYQQSIESYYSKLIAYSLMVWIIGFGLPAIVGYKFVYSAADRDHLLKDAKSLIFHLLLIVGLAMVLSLIVGVYLVDRGTVGDTFSDMFLAGLYPFWYPSMTIADVFNTPSLISVFSNFLRPTIAFITSILGFHLWYNSKQSAPQSPTWSRFGGFVLLYVVMQIVVSLLAFLIADQINYFSYSSGFRLGMFGALSNLIYLSLSLFFLWIILHVLDIPTRVSIQYNHRTQYILAFLLFFGTIAIGFSSTDLTGSFLTPISILLSSIISTFLSVCLIIVLIPMIYGLSETIATADQELLYQTAIVQ